MEKGKYINIVFYKYILLRKNSAIEQRLSAPVKINLFSAQHTKKTCQGQGESVSYIVF